MTPELCPRMSQLARSFQRIRYHRLRFEVIASFPSVCAGAYCAGFVKDATDPINSKSAASTLLASGGTATKIWQSTEVVVNKIPDLYYTSTASSEERWSSPGSFVITQMASNDQAGSYQVFLHWDVSFSEPTYETPEGAGDDGFATALADLYASSDNPYLGVRGGGSWVPASPAHFSPKLQEGDVVRVLGMRYAATENSSGTLDGIFGFCLISCYSSGGQLYLGPVDDKGARTTQNFHGVSYVMAKGEKGELTRKTPNSLRGSWYLCPKRPCRGYGKPRSPYLIGQQSPPVDTPSDPTSSYFQECMGSTSQEYISPTLEKCTPPCETLRPSSEMTPPLDLATLSRSLEQLMKYLRSSQEESADCDSEFEEV